MILHDQKIEGRVHLFCYEKEIRYLLVIAIFIYIASKYFQNRFASPILKTFSERSFTETVPPMRNSTLLRIVLSDH